MLTMLPWTSSTSSGINVRIFLVATVFALVLSASLGECKRAKKVPAGAAGIQSSSSTSSSSSLHATSGGGSGASGSADQSPQPTNMDLVKDLKMPRKPMKFNSRQQLKEYLTKLNEYYAITGRPRFGRSVRADAEEAMSASGDRAPRANRANAAAEQASSEHTNVAASPHQLMIPTSMIIALMDTNGDSYISRDELDAFLEIFE